MAETVGAAENIRFEGEVLLCEDSEINQYVINSYLTEFGLKTQIAGNGKDGVDIVAERIKSGAKPFDLIFMDIYMPVMDGTEAAAAIRKLDANSQIVALTANVTPEDVERYRQHGMTAYLHKPVIKNEMGVFLRRYFTPVGNVKNTAAADDEEEKRRRLLTGFVKRNSNTYNDIKTALKNGDVKLAHRLAHTLKGLAGLIGRPALMEASQTVENLLAAGRTENITEQLSALNRELNLTLLEIKPVLEKYETAEKTEEIAFDKAHALKVFGELEPLLRADSARSIKLVSELRKIPGTETLVEQIEEYELESALETLLAIKNTIGGRK